MDPAAGHVHRQRLAAAGTASGREAVGLRLRARGVDITKHDMRAFIPQVLGDLQSESLRRSRHHRDQAACLALVPPRRRNAAAIGFRFPMLDELPLPIRHRSHAAHPLCAAHDLDGIDIDKARGVRLGEIVPGGKHTQTLHQDDQRSAAGFVPVLRDRAAQPRDQGIRSLLLSRLKPQWIRIAVHDLIRSKRAGERGKPALLSAGETQHHIRIIEGHHLEPLMVREQRPEYGTEGVDQGSETGPGAIRRTWPNGS